MSDKLSYADSRKKEFRYLEKDYDIYEGEPFDVDLLNFDNEKNFNVKKKDIAEILAPASVSTYKQAVYGGADAIYFGYKEFNARAGGENFESIKEVVDFCHFYNVKAYLALNICFTGGELKQVKDIIIEAEEAAIDAFIVCDLSILPIIRKYSTAAIHASTQIGAHNSWGISFLKEMGFDRAVLSREVNFQDVKNLTCSQSLETEVFVHGALCSCFSGGCLLSSMLTGNSANRGKCNQLCRKYYKSTVDGKPSTKGYLLSAKDICLDKEVSDLVDIGVSSLKIEGRLKRKEYVGGVSTYYSDIKNERDAIFTKEEMKILFNRGDFTSGYFDGNNVIYSGQPNHIGVYSGKIVHLLNDYTAYVSSETPLNKDDGYKILRNKMEVGGAVATGEYKKGFSVIKSNSKLKIGDEVRLTSDKNLANFINERKKRKLIGLKVRLAGGEKPKIILNIKGNKYEYTGDTYLPFAINQPITEEEIKGLFEGSKVREVKFIVTDIELYDVFMTKAQMNKLRRDVLDCVWKFLLGYYNRSKRLFREHPFPKYPEETATYVDGDFCEIDCIEKVTAVKKKIKNIVYNPSKYTYKECEKFYNFAKSENCNIFLKLPIYIPTTREKFFETLGEIFDGICANNIGGVFLAKKLKKLLLCGQNLNITNTKNWLIKNSCSYIVSTELNYSVVKRFNNPLIYAYGNLPLMYLNYCPRKLAGMLCDDCNKELKFIDEKGEYLITTQKFDFYCEHVLRNGILTDIGNTYDQARKYFDFCLADNKEIKRVFDNYYGDKKYKPLATNKLHLSRGFN